MIDQTEAIVLVIWAIGFVPLLIGLAKGGKIFVVGICWVVSLPAFFVVCLFAALLYTAITGIPVL